jgi:hypothetical protein
VCQRSGCEQSVHIRELLIDAKPPPEIRDTIINRENAVAEMFDERDQPFFERLRFFGVGFASQLDTAANLTNEENAREKDFVVRLVEPHDDLRASALSFSQLGEDVRIE